MRNRISKSKYFIISLFLLIFLSKICFSQEVFPSRPVTFITPLPPGSTGDIAPRLICKSAEKYLGQSIIVVNKPGGATVIGTSAIANSKPDGYTVGYTPPSGMLIAPYVEKVPYHPLNDFQQIIQFTEANFGVTIKSNSPFKNFKDIIIYAKQNPGKLTYATKGVHDIANITFVQILKKEGIQMKMMPFKGGSEIMSALLGGHVNIGVGDFNYSLLESGEIRLLLLLGEKLRSEYPQTPILKDLGYDILPAPIFLNIAGPKGIPAERLKKLEDAFTQAMNESTFINGLKELRFPIVYRNSREMTNLVHNYFYYYGSLLKEIGLIK